MSIETDEVLTPGFYDPMHIDNENIVCVDVDDTLLMWEDQDWSPNQANIDALIREHKRGKFVIVWSKAGGEAAKRAVSALQIGKYVNMTMAKPGRVIDDKEPNSWLHRSYYKNGERHDG